MKALKYIILFLSAVAISGCGNSWLDLEPENKVPLDETMKTLKDARYSMNAVYNVMQSADYYGAVMMYYGDLRGEDFQSKKSSDRGNGYYRYNYSANNAPSSLWATPYKVTRLANNILARIDELMEEDEVTCKDIKGQALTARALALFDLTRVYGYPYTKDNGASLGVPVVRETQGTDFKPKRDTVRTCYRYIIQDLTEAIPLLKGSKFQESEDDDDEDLSSYGRLNQWAARALLCRVYLYKGDYRNALTEAKELIKDAEAVGYRLWTNAEYKADAWAGKVNTELFFGIVNTNISGADKESVGYLYWRKGYAAIIPSGDFLDFMGKDTKDVRYKLLKSVTEGSEKVFYHYKYLGEGENEDPRMADIRILRLSEVYLIAAEAAAHLGENKEAVTYLRPIVERGNPAKTVKDSKTVTIDQVLDERRKELAGEGHRAFDMLRNGKTIKRASNSHLGEVSSKAREFNWDYYRTVLAIPRSEMDTNENMMDQQNPGY